MKLDFPFPDGTLVYDCHACGYQCCSGLDTELFGSEIESLLTLRPELRPLTAGLPDGAAGATLMTFGPRCFLLGERGDCRLESKLGRSAKPWVCRLYPFNEVWRIGGTYVFNVHVIEGAVVCPFSIDPGNPLAVRHALLEREILALGADHPVWSTARASPALHADEARLFEDEREARAALLEADDFVGALAAACSLGRTRSESLAAELRKRVGLPLVNPVVGEAALLAALAPSLRLSYYCRFADGGYSAARAALARYVTLGWLYVQAIAKWQGRSPTAELALKAFDKLGPRLQLGTLLGSPYPRPEALAEPSSHASVAGCAPMSII